MYYYIVLNLLLVGNLGVAFCSSINVVLCDVVVVAVVRNSDAVKMYYTYVTVC